MATVTIHQWTDLELGLSELRRVTRGPVVILTLDPDTLARFWLVEYIPELMRIEQRRFPAIDRVTDALRGIVEVRSVPVPIDCADGFAEAFYARPEAFLDPRVRKGQSAWGFVEDDVIERAITDLRTALDSGEWDRRHGALRTQPEFAGSLRLITAQPCEAGG